MAYTVDSYRIWKGSCRLWCFWSFYLATAASDWNHPQSVAVSCLLFIAFCYSPGQIRLSSSLRRCYTQVLRFLTGRWNTTWQHVRCHPATLPPWQAIQWLKQNDSTPCRSWVFKWGWSVDLSSFLYTHLWRCLHGWMPYTCLQLSFCKSEKTDP